MNNQIDNQFESAIEVKSPLNLAMIFGVGVTVMMFTLQLISKVFTKDLPVDSTLTTVFGVVTYVLLLAMILYFIIMHRDRNCGGQITYGKAFGAAMLMVLLYSLMMALVMYIWFAIDESLLIDITKRTREAIEKRNPDMDEDKLETQIAMATKFQTPLLMTIFSFIGNIIFGAILSLLASAFNGSFRKKQTSAL